MTRRPRFEEGRLLRTSDFVDEQAYHLAQQRRHNVTGHVWGIGAGLDLVLLEGVPAVTPGIGIDGYGRHVVLTEVRQLDLRSFFDVRGVDAVDVWIAYDRREIPGSGDEVDILVDSASVEPVESTGDDPRRPPGVPEVDLDDPARRDAPDDPGRRWPLYLGRVLRPDPTKPGSPPILRSEGRPWIGLVGGSVVAPGGDPWLELGATPPSVSVVLEKDGKRVVPLRVVAEGAELGGTLDVDGELVLRGGWLTLEPGTPPIPVPATAASEWTISHAQGDVSHDLRITMPEGASAVVVGAWKDNEFVPSLRVDASGTVMIAGNLVVTGQLRATSVQEAQLSDEGRALLMGLTTTGLQALFTLADLPPA